MPIATIRTIPALLVLVLIAACAAPAPAPERGFRDPTAPFASTSRFDTARFAGEWVRVAAFTASGQTPASARYLYRTTTTGQIVADVTGADGVTQRQVYDLAAAGRFRAIGQESQQEELWLLWVDEGFRTAVLGTPSGSQAFILDRSATPAPDRLRAALEILDWYGYDMTRLQSAL